MAFPSNVDGGSRQETDLIKDWSPIPFYGIGQVFGGERIRIYMSFGVLTLATPNDYQKAIGLALSVRVSNPGVPVAVACPPDMRKLVSPYFDYVADQDPNFRGFAQKINLDRYTPFEETFFFDSDVLVFRPLQEVIDSWRAQPYSACGNYASEGTSAFGFDIGRALKLIGKERLVRVDGAGHAYFRKPECLPVFDLARKIAANYRYYAGDARFADEDAMNVVMTMLDLAPMPHLPFWSSYHSIRPGSLVMDAAQAVCHFDLVVSEDHQHPYMMHFYAKTAPFLYARELRSLFRKFEISRNGLLQQAIRDYYTLNIKWAFKAKIKRLVKLCGFNHLPAIS